jgi:hypothetical protein
LTRVDVLLAVQSQQINTDDVLITIFDTVDGVPHAPITAPFHIAAASVPYVDHPSTWDRYSWLSAHFELPVTAGDVLAIVASTGPTSQYYWPGCSGYPGGQVSGATGSTWSPYVFGNQEFDQEFRTFVAPSRPPTANAGTNQTARPGATVTLDGSGSYDDNTATTLLQYAWSFVSVPPGSAVTALMNANGISPSFVADVAGDYVVQLVVTDQEGLFSLPSQVTIGENPPPTATAGPDQLVIVNTSVMLNGSALDPDGDTVTYQWQFTRLPAGSNAQFAQPALPETSFVPDLPGVYVAALTPTDFVGPGISASATITVTTAMAYAEIQAQAAATQVLALSGDEVTTAGNQNAFIQLLSNAVIALQNGNLVGGRHMFREAISRTDGCTSQGSPDGNGPGRDWITSCAAQEQIYPVLVACLTAIVP